MKKWRKALQAKGWQALVVFYPIGSRDFLVELGVN